MRIPSNSEGGEGWVLVQTYSQPTSAIININHSVSQNYELYKIVGSIESFSTSYNTLRITFNGLTSSLYNYLVSGYSAGSVIVDVANIPLVVLYPNTSSAFEYVLKIKSKTLTTTSPVIYGNGALFSAASGYNSLVKGFYKGNLASITSLQLYTEGLATIKIQLYGKNLS